MRRSEFDRAVDVEFGVRAGSLVSDLTLREVGYRTAREALDAGIAPRVVWHALCAETDVPEERRHGVGLIEPRKR
ncbi:MAG: DUF3046 domain-containing protein [Microbacterium sp.]